MEIRVFEFTGLTPLLMSNIASVNEKIPQLKLGTASNKGDIEKIAEAMTYRQEDGSLYLKADALRSSLLKGCKGQKFPGSRMSPATTFQATLFTAEERATLLGGNSKPIKTWEVQIDSGVNRASKSRIIIVRPRVPLPWHAVVPFEIDREFAPTNFDEYLQIILQIWNRAGRAVGVCAWRPECQGKFGRYSVTMRK